MFDIHELEILCRIIGNHVTAGKPNAAVIDRMYDKLLNAVGTDRGPYQATANHPYGNRPMIDVDTNSFPVRDSLSRSEPYLDRG